MEPEVEDMGTPLMEAMEDELARNYTEFDRLRHEWKREWQKAMQRRAMRRQAERAAQMQSVTPTRDEDDAA